jgi:hypothetical protein
MSLKRSKEKSVESARDMLLVGLASAARRISEAVADISEQEYHWESIPDSEREADILLPPDRKKVWRVYQNEGLWTYDYTPEALASPPFITIAWIMNHIAQTGDMYLYCVKTGKPEGVERHWDDLPVCADMASMRQYIHQMLADTRAYLEAFATEKSNTVLNQLTPAPWGEMRPVYKNIWGGIIGHTIEHAAQVALLKQRIRWG